MTGLPFPDQDQVRQAIATVLDPCSVNAGAPINVIDMGLILGWSIDAGRNIEIRMRLTSPGCTLAPSFMHRIETAVEAVAHVASAKVSVTGLSLWSEFDVAPESRRRLADVRSRSLASIGTRPQQWRHAVPQHKADAVPS